jgi:hypothetical protein
MNAQNIICGTSQLVMTWILAGRTTCGLIPCRCKRFIFFSKASRRALGPTQPSIQWVLGCLPKGKAAEAWSWPFTSYLVPRLSMSGTTPQFSHIVIRLWAQRLRNRGLIFLFPEAFRGPNLRSNAQRRFLLRGYSGRSVKLTIQLQYRKCLHSVHRHKLAVATLL